MGAAGRLAGIVAGVGRGRSATAAATGGEEEQHEELALSQRRAGPWTHGSWAGTHEIPERGQCRFTVPIEKDWPGSNRGAGGGVSGTILAGLVDMAAVKAAQSLWRQGEVYAGTVELNISYIRVAAGAHITVDATVLRKGRTMCFVDVDIRDDEERLVAKGRIAYSLSQPEDGSSTAEAPYFHPDSWLEKTPFEHARSQAMLPLLVILGFSVLLN